MKTVRLLTAILIAIFMAGHALAQGSLAPPGAPGVTMKTLDQLDASIGQVSNMINGIDSAIGSVSNGVESLESRVDVATLSGNASYLHIISSPGSYFLSGDILVSGPNGIHITTDHVTLDLNGFRIWRISGSEGYGIKNEGLNFQSSNGTIGYFSYGMDSSADGSYFENVTVMNCSHTGMTLYDGSRLVNCQALNNQGNGIHVSSGSVLIGCVAINNTGLYGISTGHGCTLRDCTASDNSAEYGCGIKTGHGCTLFGCAAHDNQGRYGIHTYTGCSLTGCTAYNNEAVGPDESCAIRVDSDSSLIGCSAYDNEGVGQSAGIYASDSCSLLNCVASDNLVTDGIRIGQQSIARGCSAYGNELYGEETCGLRASYGSIIIDCTASDNEHESGASNALHGVGIHVLHESIVRDCVTTENSGDGISAGRTCLVADNISSYNAYDDGMNGAGIHVVGEGTRVEGNQVANNRRGIEVSSTDGLIIRNSAFQNGVNYDIAPSNHVGTIQTNMPAVGGPWDNFSF